MRKSNFEKESLGHDDAWHEEVVGHFDELGKMSTIHFMEESDERSRKKDW